MINPFLVGPSRRVVVLRSLIYPSQSIYYEFESCHGFVRPRTGEAWWLHNPSLLHPPGQQYPLAIRPWYLVRKQLQTRASERGREATRILIFLPGTGPCLSPPQRLNLGATNCM